MLCVSKRLYIARKRLSGLHHDERIDYVLEGAESPLEEFKLPSQQEAVEQTGAVGHEETT
jgi:hypothetical protein